MPASAPWLGVTCFLATLPRSVQACLTADEDFPAFILNTFRGRYKVGRGLPASHAWMLAVHVFPLILRPAACPCPPHACLLALFAMLEIRSAPGRFTVRFTCASPSVQQELLTKAQHFSRAALKRCKPTIFLMQTRSFPPMRFCPALCRAGAADQGAAGGEQPGGQPDPEQAVGGGEPGEDSGPYCQIEGCPKVCRSVKLWRPARLTSCGWRRVRWGWPTVMRCAAHLMAGACTGQAQLSVAGSQVRHQRMAAGVEPVDGDLV